MCWFFHKWSKWCVPIITTSKQCYQAKECSKCGLTKIKWICV